MLVVRAPVSPSIKVNSDRGAVLAEAAIAIPFLIVVMSGLLGAGRLLSQLTWLNQTLYHAALLGSQNVAGSGEQKMVRRALNLCEFQDAALISDCGLAGTYVLGGSANPHVEVTLNAAVRPLKANLPVKIDLSLRVAAPYLVPNLASSNLSEFNAPNRYYNCEGELTNGDGFAPNLTSCVS